MFVKLTQLTATDSRKPVESQIAVNTAHVIEVSAVPNSGGMTIVLASAVSGGLNYKVLIKGTFDDVVARLNGKNPDFVAGAIDV